MPLVNICTHCGKTGRASPFDSELLQACPRCERPCLPAKELDGIKVYFCEGKSLDNMGTRTRCAWSFFGLAVVNGVETKLTGGTSAKRTPEACVAALKAEVARLEQEAALEERLTTRRCLDAKCRNYLLGKRATKICPLCSGEMIDTGDLALRCWNRDCRKFNKIEAAELCESCGVKRLAMPLISTKLKAKYRIGSDGKVERVTPETNQGEAKDVETKMLVPAAPVAESAETEDDDE
jgi:hypothetical protein